MNYAGYEAGYSARNRNGDILNCRWRLLESRISNELWSKTEKPR